MRKVTPRWASYFTEEAVRAHAEKWIKELNEQEARGVRTGAQAREERAWVRRLRAEAMRQIRAARKNMPRDER